MFVADTTSFHVLPLSVLTCHCTVGKGLPLAAETNVAGLPAQTACEAGWVVTTGISAAGSLQLKLISFKTGVSAVLVAANSALY